jgi:energy-coupling factor transporter ATP-binding protein EcfA2
MSIWDDYPPTYRADIVQRIFRATRAGDCVALVGLSGAGKSNVTGFLANAAVRAGAPTNHRYLLVDCNRLPDRTPAALFRAMRRLVSPTVTLTSPIDDFEALDVSLNVHASSAMPITFLLDRFDDLAKDADRPLFNQLRSLRDAHKYVLTYVTSTRRPLNAHTELAELFYANTVWLGPLGQADAYWNVARYAVRYGQAWGDDVANGLIAASGGYPSFLKACAEAHAAGCSLDVPALAAHPAVQQRIDEFWTDQPTDAEIDSSGLAGNPLLRREKPRMRAFDTTTLTAKEHALLVYLQANTGKVCEKDDIIRAVWPEDKVVERGIRDDSLAQLVRRLREKVEPDPAAPKHILTVPGRGYRFVIG